MKFTKEQAIESLKRELTNNGRKPLRMSEKTLDKVVDALLPKFADDETGLPDFIESALTILNPVNDNVGNDRSSFIKQWEKDHSSTPPAEQGEGNPAAPQGESELEALKQEVAELKKAREQEQKNRQLAEKRKNLRDKLVEKGVKDAEWLDMYLSEVDVKEDTDVDVKAESALKFYNKVKSAVNPRAVPGAANAGNGEDDVPEAIKAAKKLAQEHRRMIEGEQTK